jgi:hypothetical protein
MVQKEERSYQEREKKEKILYTTVPQNGDTKVRKKERTKINNCMRPDPGIFLVVS